MERPVTHLVLVDYDRGVGYEGPYIIECLDADEASREFDERLSHHADLRLVEIRRESTYISRRVAEAVDQ